MSLEELAAGWHTAFDAADAAIRAARECLPRDELAARAQDLVAERVFTLRILAALTRLNGLPTSESTGHA